MEPRPLRPQQPGATDPATAPPVGGGPPGAGGAPYPGYPGAPPAPGTGVAPGGPISGHGPGSTPEAAGSEIALRPRQERRRRQVARITAAFLVLLIAAVAVGFAFQDRFFAGDDDDGDGTELAVAPASTSSPTVVTETPAPLQAAASPTAGQSSVAASLISTEVPTATPPPPTPEPGAPVEATGEPTAPPQAAGPAEARPLVQTLPSEAEVTAFAPGLIMTDDSERTEEEVLAALGGTEDAAQRLDTWGWEGNVVRNFELPADAEAPPGATTVINVSPHRFASADAAAEALTYYSNIVVVAQALEEIPVEAIGDEVRALKGAPDGAPLVILYFREGATMYRVAGVSTVDGDPTDTVVSLSQSILADG